MREKEILEYADSLSREYYGLPLVVVYNGDEKILSLVSECQYQPKPNYSTGDKERVKP